MMSIKIGLKQSVMTLVVSSVAVSADSQVSEINALAIEEVIVTAQKRPQSLQEIPVAVNALSGDYLEKTNTKHFSDIVKVAPGLYISDTPDGLGQSITVRGVGSVPFTTDVRPAVNLLIDDIPLFRMDAAFTNLMDVERIEVLKGPQATLYGKEASAGTIIVTTKKPELNHFEGGLDTEFSSNERREYRAKVNIPMGEMFAARISTYYSESDGEISNTLTGKARSSENSGGRFRLLIAPRDSFELYFTHDHHSAKVRNGVRERKTYGVDSLIHPSVTLPADPFDQKIETLITQGRDTRTKNNSMHINWNVSEQWSFSSITGLTVFDRELDRGDSLPAGVPVLLPDYSVGFLPEGTPTGGDGAYTPYVRLAFHGENGPGNERTKTQEFRLNFEGENLSSLFGLFYSQTDAFEATSILSGAFPLTVAKQREHTDWSFYIHHTYHVNKQWDLVAGIRYGETKKDEFNTTSFFTGVFGDGTVPLGAPLSNTWDNVSSSLKFVYFASSDLSFYGGVSQGYKPGGFNPNAAQATFDEETTTSYEVGTKGMFLNQRLRVNASMFYQNYEDFQVQTFNPDTGFITSIFSNAAEVDVMGIEADVLWLASENLTFEGAFAYTDARYDSYKEAACTDQQKLALVGATVGKRLNGCLLNGFASTGPQGFQDLSGKRLALSSPFMANISSQYDGAFSNKVTWYARGEVAFRDDYNGFVVLEPDGHQGGVTLYNASLGIKSAGEGWSVSIFGKNLLDKDYVGAFFPGRDGLGGVVVVKGAGRTVGVSAKYSFDN